LGLVGPSRDNTELPTVRKRGIRDETSTRPPQPLVLKALLQTKDLAVKSHVIRFRRVLPPNDIVLSICLLRQLYDLE
jgi:hypothetical protein